MQEVSSRMSKQAAILTPKDVRLKFTKGSPLLKLPRWGIGLGVLLILSGGGFAAFRQLVVVPRQAAANRILTEPVQRQNLAIAVSANAPLMSALKVQVS
jgi:hypothetical protein